MKIKEFINPYEVLGLDKKCTQEEIKKRYRSFVHKYHPDVNPEGKEMFVKISQAYAILNDPKTREQLDKYGHVSNRDPNTEKIHRALTNLAMMFKRAIQSRPDFEHTDYFKILNENIDNGRIRLEQDLSKNKTEIKLYKAVKKRIKQVKDKQEYGDIFTSAIDEEIKARLGKERYIKEELDSTVLMKSVLAGYKYEVDKGFVPNNATVTFHPFSINTGEQTCI